MDISVIIFVLFLLLYLLRYFDRQLVYWLEQKISSLKSNLIIYLLCSVLFVSRLFFT